MESVKEKQKRECFEKFMERREFNDITELINYVMYLEDIKSDYEVLKNRIANLNRLAEEMY